MQTRLVDQGHNRARDIQTTVECEIANLLVLTIIVEKLRISSVHQPYHQTISNNKSDTLL